MVKALASLLLRPLNLSYLIIISETDGKSNASLPPGLLLPGSSKWIILNSRLCPGGQ